MVQRQLRDVCGVRSGDKGDISDLTLFADSAEGFELLRREVTVEAVATHFGPMVSGSITRYEAPNVLALKFVMTGALGGGGPLTLRSDNLGKTLGGALLRLRIEVPDSLLTELPRAGRVAPTSDREKLDARRVDGMIVRLGGGQAGYGDSTEPVVDLVAAGIDYLVCDALAESTLAVLQKDRQRDPALGYARDLPEYVAVAASAIAAGRTRLITNAGGLNPAGAAQAVLRGLAEAGITGITVATVFGDDVLDQGGEFGVADDALFANVYLGARPIAQALADGAQIVITGRVADASLFLAPLVHEFGWSWSDYDRMAAGITIGHLLECSSQVSGSVYSGPWWQDPDPGRPGYPIAEVDESGRAIITKPDGTGGQVSFDTVREQLMYEVQDPSAYLNPDCTADLTAVQLRDLGGDRVEVSGARGGPPPPTYKGLYCQPAGWMGDMIHTFSWPDAEAKAHAALRLVRQRAERRGIAVQEWCEEYFGAGAHHGYAANEDLEAAAKAGFEPPEVVARLAWRCADRDSAAAVGQRGGGLALPMASPLGRPKRREPSQLLALHAFAVDRARADQQVRVETASC